MECPTEILLVLTIYLMAVFSINEILFLLDF